MSNRIVLVGEANSPNLGDSVICRVSQLLTNQFHPFAKVVLLDISIARRPNHPLLCFVRDKFEKSRYSAYYRLYFSFFYYCIHIPFKSRVCLVGGALFQDFFSESLRGLLLASKSKKSKINILSLGIGPLSKGNFELISSLLKRSNISFFSLRDGETLFRNLNIPVNKCADVAILSKYVYPEYKGNRIVVGWGVISTSMYNSNNQNCPITDDYYIDKASCSIKEIIQRGYLVEIFTNGDLGDYILAEKLYSKFVGQKYVSLLQRPTSDLELVNIIQKFRFVISSRLHSLIISYSFGIPFFALAWDPKVYSFAAMVDCIDNVTSIVELDNIDWNVLLNTLLKFTYNNDIRQDLEEKVFNQLKRF